MSLMDLFKKKDKLKKRGDEKKKSFIEKEFSKFKKYLGKKDANAIPEELMEQEEQYEPLLDKPLRSARDLEHLNFLARTENPAVEIVSSGAGSQKVDLVSGKCHLPIGSLNSIQKKAAVYHVASHCSITPPKHTLDEDQQEMYNSYKEIADMIEDIRVNRYTCYKYRGLMRYIKDVDQKKLSNLSIGDLTGEEELGPEHYTENALEEVLYEYKDIIRACESYNDVLQLSEAIWEETVEKEKDKSDDTCKCGGEETKDKYGWKTGKCSECGKDKEKKETPVPKMTRSLTREGVDSLDKKKRDKGSILFGHEGETPSGEHKGVPVEGIYGKCIHVKKDAEYFHGLTQEIKPFSVGQRLLRYLLKEVPNYRYAKSGKFDKFDPVKMKTSQRIYKRRNVKKRKPHFYFIMDCSGSMGEHSQNWQKRIVTTFTNVLRRANIKYTIIAHTGKEHYPPPGEFIYAEIKDRDIKHLEGKSANLDGTMMKVVLDQYVRKYENSVVFYMSDGGLPMEYREFEGPELKKNLKRARQMGVPVFAIGLGTADVSGWFDEWCVVHNGEDLKNAIRLVGQKIRKTV
jgi:hypothetical protein